MRRATDRTSAVLIGRKDWGCCQEYDANAPPCRRGDFVPSFTYFFCTQLPLLAFLSSVSAPAISNSLNLPNVTYQFLPAKKIPALKYSCVQYYTALVFHFLCVPPSQLQLDS
ncbi:hypothetical protein RJ641_036683 [Dillenia turbinata]|uniref:Uncharacterized protein n=1 Tax=Dillenia turbinata TaxID=194707 RepID=A0AAN8VHP8_9MAGN